MSSGLHHLRKVLQRQEILDQLKKKFLKSEQDVVQQMSDNSFLIRVNEGMLIKLRFAPFLESKDTFAKSILLLQKDLDDNGRAEMATLDGMIVFIGDEQNKSVIITSAHFICQVSQSLCACIFLSLAQKITESILEA